MTGTAGLGRLSWQAADVVDVVVETPPDGTRVELTVERLDDGEGSPHLSSW